jgi:hypothetical protein
MAKKPDTHKALLDAVEDWFVKVVDSPGGDWKITLECRDAMRAALYAARPSAAEARPPLPSVAPATKRRKSARKKLARKSASKKSVGKKRVNKAKDGK